MEYIQKHTFKNYLRYLHITYLTQFIAIIKEPQCFNLYSHVSIDLLALGYSIWHSNADNTYVVITHKSILRIMSIFAIYIKQDTFDKLSKIWKERGKMCILIEKCLKATKYLPKVF